MILRNVYSFPVKSRLKRYYCRLTKELDILARIDPDTRYYHSIIVSDIDIKKRCLPIRVPGTTVGGICLDDNNVITKVEVESDGYICKNYPEDINEILEKYIGEMIEIDD